MLLKVIEQELDDNNDDVVDTPPQGSVIMVDVRAVLQCLHV